MDWVPNPKKDYLPAAEAVELIFRCVSEECVDSEGGEEVGGGEGVEHGGVEVGDTCTSANGVGDPENKMSSHDVVLYYTCISPR